MHGNVTVLPWDTSRIDPDDGRFGSSGFAEARAGEVWYARGTRATVDVSGAKGVSMPEERVPRWHPIDALPMKVLPSFVRGCGAEALTPRCVVPDRDYRAAFRVLLSPRI